MVRLAVSPNISALKTDKHVIGSRVINRDAFISFLVRFVTNAIPTAEFDSEDGYCTITLPSEVLPFVSSGVERRSKNEKDYVARTRFGQVDLYLKREFALPPEECTVNILTTEHYLKECKENEEDPLSDSQLEGITHVVVGIGVHAGPRHGYIQDLRGLVNQLANLIGEPNEKVIRVLNSAWEINSYWRSFAKISD